MNIVIALAVVLLLGGCGGGKESPTAPTAPAPPTPTIVSVAVAITNEIILRGSSEMATATVTLSNGTTQPGTAALWNSENSAVASVDGSGRVTGNQSGRTTINYTAQGVGGSRNIRVVPSYTGSWSGSYIVRGCDQSGIFVTIRFCVDTFPTNRVLPTNLTLSQGTRDVVSGRFFLGQIQSDTFTAAIETDGAIQFSGVLRSGQFDIDSFWRINSLQDGRIVGALTQRWTSPGFSGQANVASEVRDLNR